jgi:hypothetical protein
MRSNCPSIKHVTHTGHCKNTTSAACGSSMHQLCHPETSTCTNFKDAISESTMRCSSVHLPKRNCNAGRVLAQLLHKCCLCTHTLAQHCVLLLATSCMICARTPTHSTARPTQAASGAASTVLPGASQSSIILHPITSSQNFTLVNAHPTATVHDLHISRTSR